MKKPLFKRVMTLMLAALMSFSGMSFRATTVRADSSSTWEKVDSIADAVSSGKQGKWNGICFTERKNK